MLIISVQRFKVMLYLFCAPAGQRADYEITVLCVKFFGSLRQCMFKLAGKLFVAGYIRAVTGGIECAELFIVGVTSEQCTAQYRTFVETRSHEAYTVSAVSCVIYAGTPDTDCGM